MAFEDTGRGISVDCFSTRWLKDWLESDFGKMRIAARVLAVLFVWVYA